MSRSQHLVQRSRRTFLGIVLAVLPLLVVAACGGSSDAVPTPSGSAPVATPTQTAVRTEVPVPTLTWTPCEGRFQCATMPVRLGASGQTMDLAVARLAASDPDHRIGSLIVNPGGPGAGAIDFLESFWPQLPAALGERFDLVAFDPRGVGRSQAVHCLDTAGLDAFNALDPSPDTPVEVARMEELSKGYAQGCQDESGSILSFVGTKDVAADMDLLRAALGEQTITYLGYSYGTSLGAAYLDAFPTRVRAMVLDGAIDPTITWDQFLVGQSAGFDTALQAFLDNCQQVSCPFRQAVTGNLGAAFDTLMARIDATPLPGTGGRTVGPGEASYGVGQGMYSSALWPTLGKALASAQAGDGKGLLQLSDSYLERSNDGYAPLGESNFAVNCIDRPWAKDPQAYVDLAAQVARTSPRFGPGIVLSGLPCAYWPDAPVSTPHAVRGTGAPTVVVMGSTRDPATPYQWAQGLAAQLDKAVLLTRVGDGHTTYRSSAKACLRDPVTAYLVDVTVPAAVTC